MNLRELQNRVATLQNDLLHFGPRLARVLPDFSYRYAPAMRRYPRPFRVKKLSGDGAFEAARRQLTFNATSFEMFHAPIDSLQASGNLPPDIAAIARDIAVEQLVLHEISHITVGLVHFSDVKALKGLIGVSALGELDLIADVSAARIGARLEMLRAQERGSANFASRLLQQLYVMGNYAFPAFRAPADKPHKRQRFLGLAMMAARILDFMQRTPSCQLGDSELPIDTPLHPHFDADGNILISAFMPDRVIWGTAARVSPELLQKTCDDLDRVPFAVSVARAGILLQQIGKIKGPINYQDAHLDTMELAAG